MKRYVFQDGADFYAEEVEVDEVTHLWTAPFKVLDRDMAAADKARTEFRTWCEMSDIQAVF